MKSLGSAAPASAAPGDIKVCVLAPELVAVFEVVSLCGVHWLVPLLCDVENISMHTVEETSIRAPCQVAGTKKTRLWAGWRVVAAYLKLLLRLFICLSAQQAEEGVALIRR